MPVARRIVLLGPPGAGKGTQAKRIRRAHGMPHISTGDIFRAHIHNQTPIGRRIAEYVNNGKLAPDSLACKIVADRLAEPDCANGYLLDGFPRTLPQAEEFDRLLGEREETLDLVIDLEVPDDELVDRLTDRRICPNCGKIYNLKLQPPKRDMQCDKSECDGARLEHREDDQEETIRERLKVYYRDTAPVIEYYKEKGLLRAVGGQNQSPGDIAVKIEEILTTGVI